MFRYQSKLNKVLITLYRIGLGYVMDRFMLLLTTTGRRTGKQRTTPLQYEKIEGVYVVGSMRGVKADWVRNIKKTPQVSVQIGFKQMKCSAEIVSDLDTVTNFVEYRLEKHPTMIGKILRADGVPENPNRKQLENYSENIAIVRLYPE